MLWHTPLHAKSSNTRYDARKDVTPNDLIKKNEEKILKVRTIQLVKNCTFQTFLYFSISARFISITF